MPLNRRIPEATVARLPIYQRLLLELVGSGTGTVSSEQLAAMAGVNASKVRKDLSFLGSFGTRGSGYEADFLLSQIDRELGLDHDWPVAIVGIGNLGRALANAPGFTSRGFRVSALFDVAPSLIGARVRGIAIRHLDDFEEELASDPPAIGVIATPAADAQSVADRMVQADIRAILNFASRVLTVPPGVLLRDVDLSIELQVISFHLSHQHEAGAPPAGSQLAVGPVLGSLGLARMDR